MILEHETTSQSVDKSPFTKDQLKLLYKMRDQSKSSSNHSSHFAKLGNIGFALNASKNISSKP